MRRAIALIVLGAMLGVGLVLELSPWTRISHRSQADPTLTIERVRALSTWVTTAVQVSDQVTVTERGFTGDLTVVYKFRGTVWIGPDLTKATLVDCDPQHRTATLILPNPTVLGSSIDLAASRFERPQLNGLWAAFPYELLILRVQQQALQDAEIRIRILSIERRTIFAKRIAQAQIARCTRSLGWGVQTHWKD